MRTLLIVISILSAWATAGTIYAEVENDSGNTPRSLEQASQTWQVLDYLADDYRGAVAGGRIVSASEYAEMREFAASIRTQLRALPAVPASSALQEAAERLEQSIADKDAPHRVPGQRPPPPGARLAPYPLPPPPPAPPHP